MTHRLQAGHHVLGAPFAGLYQGSWLRSAPWHLPPPLSLLPISHYRTVHRFSSCQLKLWIRPRALSRLKALKILLSIVSSTPLSRTNPETISGIGSTSPHKLVRAAPMSFRCLAEIPQQDDTRPCFVSGAIQSTEPPYYRVYELLPIHTGLMHLSLRCDRRLSPPTDEDVPV